MANSGSGHFFNFTFDWDRDELRRDGGAVKLRPKTLALLRALLQRPGEVISKNELTRLVWPDLAVTDVVLNVCVAELRRAFGDTASQPRFLETVHRRGFRFIAPIAADRSGSGHGPAAADGLDVGVFVGRRAELGILTECWDRVVAGQLQVVIVSGDAGIGKTALADQFLLDLTGEAIIGRGQCLDLNAAAEPFLPVLEALQSLCNGPAGARVNELIRQHAPSWQPHLSSSAATTATVRGERGHESMVRELVAALSAITQEHPAVLVLEDLHWSDPSTVDLVAALAQTRAPSRLLVIGSLRPADAILQGHPRRLLRLASGVRGRVREVPLELLREESVRQYLERRLGDVETAALLAPHVAARTDGSPLFMVAVVDQLIDGGALQHEGARWRVTRPLDEIAEQIPPSVTRLLREEIAGFDPRERAAIEAACVAGALLTSQAVAAGMEYPLEEAEVLCADLVERRRFLVDCGPVEWRDGSLGQGYRFRHIIYRQVVEGLLTGGHRQALHLRIGARLERGYGDRADEIAGAVAVHFHAGGDYERAFKYSKLAGRRAMERSAYQESIDHMRAAHTALQRLPPGDSRDRDELRLLTYLGPLLVAVRGVDDTDAEALAVRLRDLARRTGQQLAQLASYARSTVVWRTRGEIQIADAVAQEVLLLAQELGEEALLLSAHFLIGGNRFHCADFAAARHHFEAAVDIADRRDDIAGNLILEGIATAARCQLAATLLLSGAADAARDTIEAALDRHSDSGLPIVRATLSVLAAWVFVLLRDVDRVDALITAAVDCQPPVALWSSVAQMMRGWARVHHGRTELGLADLESGFAEYVASQGEASTFDYQVLRADAYLCAGRHSEAMRVVDEGMETLARYKQVYFAPEMYRIRGELLAAEPIRAEKAAMECWQEGLALARSQKASTFELRLGALLARSMMGDGRDVAARRLLRPLLARVEKGGVTGDVIEARRLLGALRP